MSSESWTIRRDDRRRPARPATITDQVGRQRCRRPTALRRWVALTHDVQRPRGQLFLVGNGASAAMASHLAADACKNGGLRAHGVQRRRAVDRHRQRSGVRPGVCAAARPLRPRGRPADRDQQLRQLAEHRAGARERAQTSASKIVTLTGKAAGQPRADARRPQLLRAARPLRLGRSRPIRSILHYWLDQYLNRHGQGAI